MKVLLSLGGLVVCANALWAQAPAPAGRVIGEVTEVDAGQHEIAMKSDKGDAVKVTLAGKTLFLQVPPGETDLKKAIRTSLYDIAAGDRVLARGAVSEDGKSVAATAIIVMSKTDLAQMHQRRREEWQKGVAGVVTSVDEPARRVTVNVRTPEGMKPLAVHVPESTKMWRYAPDSVKFAEALPSGFGEIKVGDQVRVLGEKDADGTLVEAEQLVSGAFRQVAGQVVSVNPSAGEIRLTDFATKRVLTVKVNEDSSLKRLPPMVAAMLARRLNPSGTSAPAPATPARGGDPQQMMERMPAMTLAELKAGDDLIVSSTAGADPARLTAIAVIAGVEPLLRAAPERATNFGGWNFGEIGLPQ